MSGVPTFRRTRILSPCKRNGELCKDHRQGCRESCSKWKIYETLRKAEREKREREWLREITLKNYKFENKERARKNERNHR